jgi:RNA polymerase sigma factor (sigma-70 family)
VIVTGRTVSRSPEHFLLVCEGRPVLLLPHQYEAILQHTVKPAAPLLLAETDADAINSAFGAAGGGWLEDVLERHGERGGYRLRAHLSLIVEPALVEVERGLVQAPLRAALQSCQPLDLGSWEHLEMSVLHVQLQGTPATPVWSRVVSRHPAFLAWATTIAGEEAGRMGKDRDYLLGGAWLLLSIRFTHVDFSFDYHQGRLENWLATVLRQACHEVVRNDQRARNKEKATNGREDQLMKVVDNGAERQRQAIVAHAALLQAINDLDDELRLIVSLRRLGKSLSEIASQLGHNKCWVQRRWEEAREILRRRLEDQDNQTEEKGS